MHVSRVTLIIETSDGGKYVLTENDPAPRGDNPRFMGQQLSSAVVSLEGRGHRLIQVEHGAQIAWPPPETASDG